MALRVGFVGLGNIGKPMARRLVAAGLETSVLDACVTGGAAGLAQEKLEEVTRSNGNLTDPMLAFLALHKMPAETRRSDGTQAMLRSFMTLAEKDLAVTLAFARECGVSLPGTGLVSQLMARLYAVEDAGRR